MPKVTVITTVYNCQNYIDQSIKSILNQTFKDFEYIIVNDGSTDKTLDIISKFISEDKRIIIIANETNLGRSKSLNLALERAEGKYIVLQDADDISSPERIEKQFTFLENNPDYVLVGSNILVVDENENFISEPLRPVNNLDAKFNLLFRCTFANPSLMYRKKIIDENNLRYDANFIVANDFRIISLMSQHGKVFNLVAPLVKYRKHSHNQSTLEYDKLISESIFIVKENLTKLGLSPSNDQVYRILNLLCSRGINREFIYNDIKFIFKVIEAFQSKYGDSRNEEVLYTLKRMRKWIGKKNILLRPKYFSLYASIQLFILKNFFIKN